MDFVEHLTWEGKPLCIIVRAGMKPQKTTFVTPLDFNLQLGFIVYPAQGEVVRHIHPPLERQIFGTNEVLIVQTGSCEMDIYSDAHTLVFTRTLQTGDVVLIVGGGHGFRMREDTTLLEVKQGPYIGMEEKERF